MLHLLAIPLLNVALAAEDAPELTSDAITGAPPGAVLPESALGPGDPFPEGFDLEWLGPLSDNLRFTLDLSGRFEYDTAREEWSISQFYGFDLYKVISGKQGDIATMVLQGFATRIDNNPAPPWFFDGPTDWQWVYRMFYINWKLAPAGAMNLKVGHFEMPFGLEMQFDTNGTLQQFDTAANLGIKADWGLTVNGLFDGLEYEVGLGRGSGNEWQAAGSPYTAVGRIGLEPINGWWVGVSGFSADLYRPSGTIRRQRVGVDAGVEWQAWTLMGELSVGRNEGTDILHALGTLSWQTADETIQCYGQLKTLQLRDAAAAAGSQTQTVLGVDWAADRHWTLSAQWVQNLERPANGSREAAIRLQARYRF